MSDQILRRVKELPGETICVSVLFSWATAGISGTARLLFAPFDSKDDAVRWAAETEKVLLRTLPIRLAGALVRAASALREECGPAIDEVPYLPSGKPALTANIIATAAYQSVLNERG